MKKYSILIICIYICATTLSRAQTNISNRKSIDSTIINKVEKDNITYRLFPTTNRWTFIKLNTRNGKIWQVQYDVEGENRFEVFLNKIPLIAKDYEENGRFTLYPTQNIYNFILLDQIDGRLWQTQWSIEAKNRVIIPID